MGWPGFMQGVQQGFGGAQTMWNNNELMKQRKDEFAFKQKEFDLRSKLIEHNLKEFERKAKSGELMQEILAEAAPRQSTAFPPAQDGFGGGDQDPEAAAYAPRQEQRMEIPGKPLDRNRLMGALAGVDPEKAATLALSPKSQSLQEQMAGVRQSFPEWFGGQDAPGGATGGMPGGGAPQQQGGAATPPKPPQARQSAPMSMVPSFKFGPSGPSLELSPRDRQQHAPTKASIALEAAGGDPIKALELLDKSETAQQPKTLSERVALAREQFRRGPTEENRDKLQLAEEALKVETGLAGARAGATESAKLAVPDKPTATERKDVATDLAKLDQIQKIEKLYRPQYVGFGQGTVGGKVRELTGKIEPNEAEFRTALASLRNQVINELSGANVPPSEYERVKAQLPDIGLPDTVFQARLKATRENLEMLATRRRQTMQGGGVDTSRLPALPSRGGAAKYSYDPKTGRLVPQP